MFCCGRWCWFPTIKYFQLWQRSVLIFMASVASMVCGIGMCPEPYLACNHLHHPSGVRIDGVVNWKSLFSRRRAVESLCSGTFRWVPSFGTEVKIDCEVGT